eukprot:PhF_6_TR8310/c0_g1_i1/m.12865
MLPTIPSKCQQKSRSAPTNFQHRVMEHCLKGMFKSKIPTGHSTEWYHALHDTAAHKLDIYQYLHRVSKNAEMTSLDLSCLRISEEEIVAVHSLLRSHPSLSEINITDTKFAPGCERYVVDAVKSNPRIFSVITNAGTTFESSPTPELHSYIAKLTRQNSQAMREKEQAAQKKVLKRVQQRETSRIYDMLARTIEEQNEHRIAVWAQWYSLSADLYDKFVAQRDALTKKEWKNVLKRKHNQERLEVELVEEQMRNDLILLEAKKVVMKISNLWCELKIPIENYQLEERSILKESYRQSWTLARRAEKKRWGEEAQCRADMCHEETTARQGLLQSFEEETEALGKRGAESYSHHHALLEERLNNEEAERRRKQREIEIMKEQEARKKQQELLREQAKEFERKKEREKFYATEGNARKTVEKDLMTERTIFVQALMDLMKILLRSKNVVSLRQTMKTQRTIMHDVAFSDKNVPDNFHISYMDPVGSVPTVLFPKVSLVLSQERVYGTMRTMLQQMHEEEKQLDAMLASYLKKRTTEWQTLEKTEWDPMHQFFPGETIHNTIGNYTSEGLGIELQRLQEYVEGTHITAGTMTVKVENAETGDAVCVEEVPMGSSEITYNIPPRTDVSAIVGIINRVWFSTNVYGPCQTKRVSMDLHLTLSSTQIIHVSSSVSVVLVNSVFPCKRLQEKKFFFGSNPEGFTFFPEEFNLRSPAKIKVDASSGTVFCTQEDTNEFNGGCLTLSMDPMPEGQIGDMFLFLEGDASANNDEDLVGALFTFSKQNKKKLLLNNKFVAEIEGELMSVDEYNNQKDSITVPSTALVKLKFRKDGTPITSSVMTKLLSRIRYTCHGENLSDGYRNAHFVLRTDHQQDNGTELLMNIIITNEDLPTTMSLTTHKLYYRIPLTQPDTLTKYINPVSIPLAEDGSITDEDTDRFHGGWFKIILTNPSRGDNIMFDAPTRSGTGPLKLDGDKLLFENNVIGRVTLGPGIGYPPRPKEEILEVKFSPTKSPNITSLMGAANAVSKLKSLRDQMNPPAEGATTVSSPGATVAKALNRKSVIKKTTSPPEPWDVVAIHIEFVQEAVASVRSLQTILRAIDYQLMTPSVPRNLNVSFDIFVGPSEGQAESEGTKIEESMEIRIVDKPLISWVNVSSFEWKEGNGKISLPPISVVGEFVETFRGGTIRIAMVHGNTKYDVIDFVPNREAAEISFRVEKDSVSDARLKQFASTLGVTEVNPADVISKTVMLADKSIAKYQRCQGALFLTFSKKEKVVKRDVEQLLKCLVYEKVTLKPTILYKVLSITVIDKNPSPTQLLCDLRLTLKKEVVNFSDDTGGENVYWSENMNSITEAKGAYAILPYGCVSLSQLPDTKGFPSLDGSEITIEVIEGPEKDHFSFITPAQQEAIRKEQGKLTFGRSPVDSSSTQVLDSSLRLEVPSPTPSKPTATTFTLDITSTLDVFIVREKKKEVIGTLDKSVWPSQFKLKFNADYKSVSMDLVTCLLNSIGYQPDKDVSVNRTIGIKIKDVKARETNARVNISMGTSYLQWSAAPGKQLSCAVGHSVHPFAKATCCEMPLKQNNGTFNGGKLTILYTADVLTVSLGSEIGLNPGASATFSFEDKLCDFGTVEDVTPGTLIISFPVGETVKTTITQLLSAVAFTRTKAGQAAMKISISDNVQREPSSLQVLMEK